MKAVQVIFENSDFNYFTDCNPAASNDEIVSYFLNNSFHVGECEDHREKPINVRFLYLVVGGSFNGDRGYIDHNAKPSPLLHLYKRGGDVLAVTKNQIKQAV